MWMRDEHNVWSELLSHRVRELCEWEMNTMYGWIIITMYGDEHNVWSELLSHRVRELCEWEMNTMYGVNYYHIE